MVALLLLLITINPIGNIQEIKLRIYMHNPYSQELLPLSANEV